MKPVDVRSRLGLRSTMIRIGVLRLRRVPGPYLPGTTVKIEGVARDVDEPVLQRLSGTTWVKAAKVVPKPDGSFSVTVKPTETTRYRLSAYALPGPTVTVTVEAAP